VGVFVDTAAVEEITVVLNQLDLQLKAHKSESDELSYLVVEIVVDGEIIANFNAFATDLIEFERSTREPGDYFIITCWCGDPLCAGVGAPVHVRHEKMVVHWRLASPAPARDLAFTLENYRTALAHARRQIERILSYLRRSRVTTLDFVPNRNLFLVFPEASTGTARTGDA
jgi:hypothetical protein